MENSKKNSLMYRKVKKKKMLNANFQLSTATKKQTKKKTALLKRKNNSIS
jgi:hypothetical protein